MSPASSDRWLWPFELLNTLGVGGMGEVYRARRVSDDRHFAVKVLSEELSNQDIVRARFERELKILTELRHPNIVSCYGGTTQGDRLYYAMDLVEGGTLQDLIDRKGRIAWGDVLRLGQMMSAGLAHAHGKGVVHRDVKPGNFLLTRNGQPKLADFGLATVSTANRLTQAGKTMGTLKYMAPEQIRGGDIVPQTDLYALGVVFYEMLTGKVPFDAETPAKIMQMHLHDPPPDVRRIALDCPLSLAEVVGSLLEKRIEDRPQSAAEVIRRLKGVGEISVVEPNLAKKKRSGSSPPVSALPATEPASTPTGNGSARSTVGLAWTVILLAVLSGWFVTWHFTSEDYPADEAIVATTQKLVAEAESDPKLFTEMMPLFGGIALQQEGDLLEPLRNLVENATDDRVRQVAAETIGDAPLVARSLAPVLQRIQQSEPEPRVRTAIGETIKKLKNAKSDRTWLPYLLVTLGGLVLWTVFTLLGYLPAVGILSRIRSTLPTPPGSERGR